jgi:hypothetical protein
MSLCRISSPVSNSPTTVPLVSSLTTGETQTRDLRRLLIKGIMSFFFISLDRYEDRNRARSGLQYFSYFKKLIFKIKFKKITSVVKILQSLESWNCHHSEDFLSANCEHSPSNYHGCGSPQQKQEILQFCWELPLHG